MKQPTSLRSQLRSRLTAMSSNRDVTTSIIRSHIIRIHSLPSSTKDVLEGGKKRILETKLNNSLALFGYKDLLSNTFLFLFLTGWIVVTTRAGLTSAFSLAFVIVHTQDAGSFTTLTAWKRFNHLYGNNYEA